MQTQRRGSDSAWLGRLTSGDGAPHRPAAPSSFSANTTPVSSPIRGLKHGVQGSYFVGDQCAARSSESDMDGTRVTAASSVAGISVASAGHESANVSGDRSVHLAADASYRGAFLEAMQKQHQARLDEQTAAAERLLHTKETELSELQSQLLEMSESTASKERSLAEELEAEKERHAQTKRKHEEAWSAQQQKFESELAELKTIRSNELQQVKQRHEDEVDALRCEYDAQITTVTANRAAVLEGLTRRQSDDAKTAAKARELATTYEVALFLFLFLFYHESIPNHCECCPECNSRFNRRPRSSSWRSCSMTRVVVSRSAITLCIHNKTLSC
eukprot:SAG31_NODE_124_length_23684_cov_7.200127_13_plen_331_part_00